MSRREGRPLKTLGAAVAGLLLCVLLSSCAASQVFGVDLTAPSTSEEVKVLARKAQGGDKLAQLELGKRFEAGSGVPKDLARAAKLYAAAAAPIDGASIRTLYTPNGGVSTTVLNGGGGAGGGLPYAAVRGCALASGGAAKASCDAMAGVGELLIFASYDMNFRGCADESGFSTWKPNPLREVRNCLADKAQAVGCDAALSRSLQRAEDVSAVDPNLVGLGVAARNLRAFCGIPASSAAERRQAGGADDALTPIDALIEAEHGRWRRHYERYDAEVFMVLMCKQTRPDVRPNLSDLEKAMCAVVLSRGDRS